MLTVLVDLKFCIAYLLEVDKLMLKILPEKDWCFTQLSTGMAGLLLLIFFNIFTQSINLYLFYYQYRCLKSVIHQIDVKIDGCSFQQVYGKIWVTFCRNTGKRFFLEVSFSSQQNSKKRY